MTDRPGSSSHVANEPDSLAGTDESTMFRSLLDTVSDAVLVLDGTGTVTAATAAFEDVLGTDTSSLIGEHVSSIVPDGRPTYRRALEIVFSTDPEQFTAESLEIPVRHADAGERWVMCTVHAHDYDGDTVTTVTLRDDDEDDEPDGPADRYRRVMETIDDGIFILDSGFNITNVNDAMVSMTGYDRERLIGLSASMLVDDDTIQEAAVLSADLLETDLETATLTADLRTEDGSTLPIETRFSVYQFDDKTHGQIGVVRDITDRKQYQETLAALNESSHELLDLETKPEVCRRIVNTATDVVDLSAAGVYLFDSTANELRLTAGSPKQAGPAEPDERDDHAQGADPERTAVGPGEGVAWDAFVDGETTITEGSESGLPSDREMCVPIGEHGLFVAGARTADSFDEDTRRLVNLLAASAEAALSRVERETELREREAERQRQNRQLRQLDQINGIIRELDQALIEADTHEDIWQAVCDKLAATDRFAFAWIGEPNAINETLEPRAWSGNERGYLDEVSFSLDESDEPSVRAIKSRELAVEGNVADDLRDNPWRKAALSLDYRSVVSVPLMYEDHCYGVLTVYANRPSAFDDMVRAVLEELGQTIANAVNAVETKRTLLTDSSVELTFRLRDADDPLCRVARQADSELTLRGSIPETDGATRLFVTARDAPAERVRSVAEDTLAVQSIRQITDDGDEGVFEAVVDNAGVASMLTDHGAAVRTITANDDEVTATVTLPDDRSVRSFVEAIRSEYPDAELLSRQSHDDPIRPPMAFRSEFEERLTDRQHEILRIAHLSGFFESPRESTRQEIADSLDVSQPTINRHLRASERKLMAMLFDDY